MSLHSVVKTAVGAGLAAPALTGHFDPAIIGTQYIEGFALLLACVGGAYASFSWGDPVEPRSKMFRLFTSCIIMGLAFSILTNFLIEWSTEGMELTMAPKASIGAFVSCITRFVMPKIVTAINDGTWKQLIPFIGRKQ